ncbi:MAG TPA: aspartate/glutamate racemase family protein [Niabella sp.]|nr:aspartate/glutamate racemase family protein [Niabella sp.]
MQILGLIGGFSWVSTVEYYKFINQGVNDQLGGLEFPQCIIYSFNYAEIKKYNNSNNWETTFQLVVKACNDLKACGVTGIILCANTMHLIADRLEKETGLPVIHIASATATAIERKELKKVALLGTKFTMEFDFFKSKLLNKGIEVIIPNEDDREFLHHTIYDELGKGIFTEQTKQRYLRIISDLINDDAEGIVLGCTELPLILQQSDISVPIFDTTLLHSKAAVEFILN